MVATDNRAAFLSGGKHVPSTVAHHDAIGQFVPESIGSATKTSGEGLAFCASSPETTSLPRPIRPWNIWSCFLSITFEGNFSFSRQHFPQQLF